MKKTITEEELRQFIAEQTGWDTDTALRIGDNIGDSLELLQLLQDIEDHYEVRLPALDLTISEILTIINEGHFKAP